MGHKKLRYISLFAGVGGFDLGLERAGHECVAQVEWDRNASGVLKRRWSDVPLFCDVTKVSADDLPDCDLITYGFPCQDLSVAGKRKGLDGKRSGLFYEATRIIKGLADRAIRRGGVGGGRFISIAENVRGLLSSGDGYDFARCIRELHDIGASEVGWTVLDSQYFGVAQRRKRVFIVSDFGGESVDEILAFSEGVSGNPAPSREAWKGTSGDVGDGFTASSVGDGIQEVANTLQTTCDDYSRADGFNMIPQAKAFTASARSNKMAWEGDISGTINCQMNSDSSNLQMGVRENLTVRRLTPIECERLQGFPDNWTSEKMELILEGNEWKATGKVVKQADGSRYAQMGNAVTVSVAEWIGKRIGGIFV